MVEYNLVSFAPVVVLWTLVIVLMKLIRMLFKWKYIHDKNCHDFSGYVAIAKKFCQKLPPRSPELECSHWKIFIPVTEISVA